MPLLVDSSGLKGTFRPSSMSWHKQRRGRSRRARRGSTARHSCRMAGAGSRVLVPQVTLAILKPDAHSCPFTLWSLANLIVGKGFKVLQSRKLRLTREQATDFYYVHEGKFFYNRLVDFMTSGTISAHVLFRVDAVRAWRDLLGNTKSYVAQLNQPGTIRGRFGTTDTRNIGHGSDSEFNAHTEIKYFFPELDLQQVQTKEPINIHSFLMRDFADHPALEKILLKIRS